MATVRRPDGLHGSGRRGRIGTLIGRRTRSCRSAQRKGKRKDSGTAQNGRRPEMIVQLRNLPAISKKTGIGMATAFRTHQRLSKKPDYAVGDKIQIILNGQVFEGVVKSVVEKADGKKYNVSFDDGKRSAAVAEWQLVK
jgi:hypothetical protein